MILSRGVVCLAQIITVMLSAGLLDQECHGGQADDGIIARRRDGSSVRERARRTVHSSFCSRGSAPTRRTAPLFGRKGRHPNARDVGAPLDPAVQPETGALGHTVRLIQPACVKPFVRRQKTDAADAQADAIQSRAA